MRAHSVSAEARLRAKSQLTLPEPVVQAADVRVGDRFVVEVAPDDPDTIRLHRIRDSYAGALRDVFVDAADYLATERATWARDA
jgi:bifunctional DNA-binding transcriptional regulator/antitoxin component of YhaV-PrlF toxin-antitoxin module